MDNLQPWLARKEWAENKIRSHSKTSLYVMWGITIFWNVISFPMLADEDFLSSIPNKPETAIALLFPLIGVGLLAASIRALRRWRRFGPTPLILDPFPGSLGGHVGGSIDTNIPFSESHTFKVSLACLKSYVSGTGKNRSRKERAIWQSEGICFSERSQTGTAVSFRFDSPSTLPESEAKNTSTYHLWRVSISCELEGLNFDRQFEIPVYSGMRESNDISNGSEDFHKTLDVAHDGIYDIADIQNIPGGIEAYFPAMKRPAGGIMASVLGSIFAGAGIVLWHSDAPGFMAVIFSLVGFLIVSFGIWDLGKSLRVRVTDDGLVSRRFFLGYPITTKKAAKQDVASIEVKEGASVSNGTKTTIYYALMAKLKSGQKIVLAERLTSRPEVELYKETIDMYFS